MSLHQVKEVLTALNKITSKNVQYGSWCLYELNARHKLETKRTNKTLDNLYQAKHNEIMQRILNAIINKTISKDKKQKQEQQ